MNRTRYVFSLLFALSITLASTGKDVEDLAAWKARLASEDQKIQDAAIKDWINESVARDADADEVVAVFLPFIRSYAVKRDGADDRGLIIEYMSRRLGPKAKAAIPDLVKLALDDTATFYMRGQAIEGLGYIAEKDPEVIAVLIKVLENPKPTSISGVHNRAAEALGRMGAAAEPARPALMKLLEHEWEIHHDAAFIALGRISETDLALPLSKQLDRLEKLKELSVSEASAVFLALEAAANNKDTRAKMARPDLAQILMDDWKPYYKSAAIRAVIAIGPGSEPSMVRALLQATLKDGLMYAPQALQAVDGTNPAAVEPLVEALKEHLNSINTGDLYYISNTLQRFGAHARPATPWLIKALLAIQKITAPNDSYTLQAQSFLIVLTNAGAQDPETLPAVLSVLSPDSTLMKNSGALADPLRGSLLSALTSLGIPQDGPLRDAALKRIGEGLKSDDPLVFSSAASAAGESASKEMVPLLLRALDENVKFKHSDHDARSIEMDAATQSLKALEKLGPLAAEALPKVSEIAARPLPASSFNFKVQQVRYLIEQAEKTKAAIEK